MEEEMVKKEEENTAVNNSRVELEEELKKLYPDEEIADVDATAAEYIRQQREFNKKMLEVLAEDPRFARVMAEVVNGGSGAAALARYFGRDFTNAEEGTPEYDEFMSAEAERQAEMENLRKATEEYNKNFDESMKSIAPFAEQNGMDADEFRMKIQDEVLIPILSGEWGAELLGKLKKALDYDKDVEDAFAAGEVQGRNTNIHQMRVKASDGMPTGLSSQAAPMEKPKVRRNPLIDAALNA